MSNDCSLSAPTPSACLFRVCRLAHREWRWAINARHSIPFCCCVTARRRSSSATHKASTAARDARALARRQLGSKLRRPAGMFIVHNEGMGMAALALEVRMVEWQILMGVLEDL